MRKQPKRKPRSSRLGDATRVDYCPHCRVSTTQRIASVSASSEEVWRTVTCEQCGSEIERNSFPKLPKADDGFTVSLHSAKPRAPDQR